MKKICIICPSAYPHVANKDIATDGGAEVQLRTLGCAFSEKGYEVHFIVDDFGQSDLEVVNDIFIHKVSFKYRGGPNYYLPVTWIQFCKELNKIGADVHLIKFPRDLLLPLGFFCKLKDRKLIFIGQTDADVDLNFLKKTGNIFSYWSYKIGLRWADHFIAQNEKQQRGFKKTFNKDAYIIKSILTLPEVKNIIKKNYILWVGNNSSEKQPEKLLELAKKLPDYNFKMIMAPTSTRLGDSFITEKLSSVPNLEYLGYIPFSMISKFFQSASLFVSTSLREGFPNTFLQAWQFRTPVVTLNVDPDGIIKKLNLGRHSETFEQLCDDVRELMKKDTLRNEMGENAKIYVYKNHSTKEVTAQYLKVIKGCL